MTTVDLAPATGDAAEGFPSLASLRAAHVELMRARREQGEAPDLLDRAAAFIRRGRATGVLLDAEADREVAQGLIDYWVTLLYRVGRQPPEAMLADFDPLLAPELDDALCPYRGLDAFREDSHELFFGRRRLIDECVERLRADRFLAVVGSSGSGKSSLVLGGIVPALRAGALPGSDGWRFPPPLVPGADPLGALAWAVAPPDADASWARSVAERLRERPDRLVELLGDRPAVLVVDQFEELFTLCGDDELRAAFADALLTAADLDGATDDASAGQVVHRVILTMRSDFEARVARLPALDEAFKAASVRVTAMGAGELREAIERPAERVGLKFEEGVVDALVRDILGEPVGLPLLQFTLLKLWEKRARNRVTWEAYRGLGNAREALANSADEFYGRLPYEDQMAARRILLRLARASEGLEVTGDRVPKSTLYAAGEARDRVDRVLDGLARARLIRRIPGVGGAEEQIQVAHEALVRNWPRLVGWLEEEREALRERQKLTLAAEEWQRVGRDANALLRGELLAEARELKDLNELEAEFVAESEAYAEEIARQEAEQRQRELESARQLAESERQRAEAAQALFEAEQRELEAAEQRIAVERRAAVRIRRLAIGLALLLAVAIGSTVIALQQWSIARSQQVVSHSNEVAATALSQISFDPELSLLLAIEAASIASTEQTEEVLRRALTESSLLKTLRGHNTQVWSAIFSPDGTQIVSAGEDRIARVWDASSGRPVKELDGHRDWVYRMSFSPDGTRLVTVSKDGTARVWNASTWELVDELRGHRGELVEATFSSDGRRIVTAGADKSARLWDLGADGRWQPGLVLGGDGREGHSDTVWMARFSHDGTRIVTASQDKTARVWDSRTGQPVGEPLHHADSVESAQFSPDGRRIATASRDETARIWDTQSGAGVVTLVGHTDAVYRAEYSPDGGRIATASADGTVRIWNAADGRVIADMRGHAGPIYRVEFSPDGTRVVTASFDATSRVWDTTSGAELLTLRGHADLIRTATFSPDGTRIVTASRDATVRIWERSTGRYLVGHADRVWTAAFNADATRIVTASEDTTARIWDVHSGQPPLVLVGQAKPVRAAAISLDGSRVATLSADGPVRLWNASDGAPLAELGSHKDVVPTSRFTTASSAQFSPDGTRVVTAGLENAARVWDAVRGGEVFALNHPTLATAAAFSPDGSRLATASLDSVARVWDAGTGAKGIELRGHKDGLLSVAFSPDGSRLITAGRDNVAKVWDLATGQLLRTLQGHRFWVVTAAFSPDGSRILTASWDRTAVVWEADSGRHVTTLGGHAGFLNGGAYSRDGRWIVTTSYDGTAQLHDLAACAACGSFDELIAAARARVTRTLTDDERERYLRESPSG